MDEVRRQLIVYERQEKILKWHDRMIPPGDGWQDHIDARLGRARIVLLFMSPHFLESKYCYYREGERALARHREENVPVIPVVLRPCAWQDSPFGELQALPRDGKPISTWDNVDAASLDVARGVMSVVDDLSGRRERP